MLLLLTVIAIAAGAYWAGTQRPGPNVRRDPAVDERGQTPHRPAATSVPTWVWVIGAVGLLVVVLGSVAAPMPFGGPGPWDIFGP